MKGFAGAKALCFGLGLSIAACSVASAVEMERGQGASADVEALPRLSISLKPLMGSTGKPTEVETVIRFGAVNAAPGATLVEMPLVTGNVITAASTLTGLSARDAAGVIPLDVQDEGAGAAGQRLWIARRAVSGDVTLSYRVPALGKTGARGPGTPVELRPDGDAVSGSGATFLLLPPGDRKYALSINWDLSGFPSGAKALSSFGPGDVSTPQGVRIEAVRDAYFMAGAIGLYPNPPTSSGFAAAWQGTTPFPAAPLMQWTRSLYGHYSQLYRQPAEEPYSVFVRYNPLNGGGGAGQTRSFVLTYKTEWPGNDEKWLKYVLAHEMYHTFQPHMDATPGTMDGSWFDEGTAVFYGWTLPYRYGMVGHEYLLAQVNQSAMRYYTSAKRNSSNDDVSKGFWSDTRVRMLAYDRSAFYFAIVDQAIRKASGGKRSLDDLMLVLKDRQDAGEKLRPEDWERLISQELGPSAVRGFRDMMAGKLQLPPGNVFGPCFRRVSVPLRRYELGFDPAVLIEPDRVVRGLVPGSEAEKAGLRNGDRLVTPVPQDVAASNQSYEITLPIRRGDREFEITYLPRGEAVPTPQWERVPDSACRP